MLWNRAESGIMKQWCVMDMDMRKTVLGVFTASPCVLCGERTREILFPPGSSFVPPDLLLFNKLLLSSTHAFFILQQTYASIVIQILFRNSASLALLPSALCGRREQKKSKSIAVSSSCSSRVMRGEIER
jgi:hypothetical protein